MPPSADTLCVCVPACVSACGCVSCCATGCSHRNANADVDRADPLLILPQLFRPTDFFVGAEIRFHHSPYQRFEVLDVDTSGSGLITAALKDGVVQSSEPEVSAVDLLLARIAWRLDGRVSSVVKTLEGYDWRVRGGVDADVAFAVFRKLGVSADVVTDEELHMALGHFARPKDGLIQYRELLTRLLDTPVPLLQPRVLFKVCGDLGVVATSCLLLLWLLLACSPVTVLRRVCMCVCVFLCVFPPTSAGCPHPAPYCS